MEEKMKKKITSILKKAKNPFYRIPKYFYYLLFISFFLMLPIIQSKIAWGHDYPFHISNLVSVSEYLSITNLNLIYTKVFGGALVNGLGYGVGIFYPPMAYVVSGYAGYFR